MTTQEQELINTIRNCKDTSKALKIAAEMLICFAMQPLSFEQQAPAVPQELD
jgi:hypothetical protein